MSRRERASKAQDVKAKTTLARLLELPESTLYAGSVHIELQANREAVIEGCSGVLEYDEKLIRLTGGGMVLKFTGRNLSIGGLDRNGIVVTGQISGIEFFE